jgi:EEF1A lysine methyltransferase 2
MAGIRWPPEDPEIFPTRMIAAGVWGTVGPAGPPGPSGEMASDDDRSVAADSWSIKSDYGSTLDDEQRYADTAEVLLSAASASSAAAPSASVAINPSPDFR